MMKERILVLAIALVAVFALNALAQAEEAAKPPTAIGAWEITLFRAPNDEPYAKVIGCLYEDGTWNSPTPTFPLAGVWSQEGNRVQLAGDWETCPYGPMAFVFNGQVSDKKVTNANWVGWSMPALSGVGTGSAKGKRINESVCPGPSN
jgi:hypothetical protein